MKDFLLTFQHYLFFRSTDELEQSQLSADTVIQHHGRSATSASTGFQDKRDHCKRHESIKREKTFGQSALTEDEYHGIKE